MKRHLILSLAAFVSFSSAVMAAQNAVAPPVAPPAVANTTGLDASGQFSQAVRDATTELAGHPELVVKLVDMQTKASGAFGDLLAVYPQNVQDEVGALVAYPDMLDELVRGGAKTDEQISAIVAKYPPDVSAPARDLATKQYYLLTRIYEFNQGQARDLDNLLKDYPEYTRAAVRTVLTVPEILPPLHAKAREELARRLVQQATSPTAAPATAPATPPPVAQPQTVPDTTYDTQSAPIVPPDYVYGDRYVAADGGLYVYAYLRYIAGRPYRVYYYYPPYRPRYYVYPRYYSYPYVQPGVALGFRSGDLRVGVSVPLVGPSYYPFGFWYLHDFGRRDHDRDDRGRFDRDRGDRGGDRGDRGGSDRGGNDRPGNDRGGNDRGGGDRGGNDRGGGDRSH